ncbi:MAG: macrolide ABC transporter ATP-binding protein [Planctomycetota bacterium]|nr:MAG: macrolide ABC transporter ATP-binding protein [Planctomycetota bacterium]
MMTSVIEIKKLKKSYFMGTVETPVLFGVDFSLNTGEYVALMGSSGSGKSTLLNILGMLDKQTSGEFLLDGTDTLKLSDNEASRFRNKKIGFVFQSFNLLANMSVLENVKVPMFYSKVPIREQNKRALELLDRVKMSHRVKYSPLQLSGGEMQRVALARALVMKPALILADEPTGNLDEKTGQDILDLLDEIHAGGASILMVTHDPEMMNRVERVIHLRDGLIDREELGGKASLSVKTQ